MFGKSRGKVAGHIVIMEPGEDWIERETLQCVHCGKHWVREPGSGTVRGFCMRCAGVTCGGKGCDVCVPYEARIEIEEGAKTPMSRFYLDDYKKITHEG